MDVILYIMRYYELTSAFGIPDLHVHSSFGRCKPSKFVSPFARSNIHAMFAHILPPGPKANLCKTTPGCFFRAIFGSGILAVHQSKRVGLLMREQKN